MPIDFDIIVENLVIVIAILLLIHIMLAITLNKLNKNKYQKSTPMSWLPIFNIYLLGKLAIHKVFGIILIISMVLGIKITIPTNGEESVYGLPDNIRNIINIVNISLFLLFFVIVIIKSLNNKKEEPEPEPIPIRPPVNTNQPVFLNPNKPLVEIPRQETFESNLPPEPELTPEEAAKANWEIPDPNKPIEPEKPEVTEHTIPGIFDDFNQLPK